jgi:hypothetical protein
MIREAAAVLGAKGAAVLRKYRYATDITPIKYKAQSELAFAFWSWAALTLLLCQLTIHSTTALPISCMLQSRIKQEWAC